MDEFLIYVNPVCKNTDGTFEYDLFFSETPDVAWGVDWGDMAPNTCSFMIPDSTTYNIVKRIRTELPFKTIQENGCYSMEFAIEGFVALSYIDITDLEDYPENGRCVLHFGDTLEKVTELLEKQKISLN